MLKGCHRICLALSLVTVAGLYSASAQDVSTQPEYLAGVYDPSLHQPVLDDSGCSAYTCCEADCIWTRPTLTGDWLGRRSCLQESGITFAGKVTQFAFGIDGGVNSPVSSPLGQGDTFKYTGRGEYDFVFDLEKFGGPPMGSLLVRAEHWFGEYGNVSLRSGAFAPPIFPALLPSESDGEGVPYITNFLWTQPLSEKMVVFAGKKDVLGGADQNIFAGGDGTHQFMNQALMANPAFILGFPYSSFTAGMVMPRQWGLMTLYAFDPQDRTADFFKLNDLFSQGVIVGGEVQMNTNFRCMPGEHHVGFAWKHVDLPDLRFSEPPPGEYPYPRTPGVPTKPDSYTIYYGFDQFLKLYSDEPRRGWGLFGRASISDGNPTLLRYFLSAGIGGDSPFGCHRGDTFGIGWYYIGASNEFGPVPRALFGPGDGNTVEIFYNFQVTPWLNVTPDVQFVRPGGGGIAEDAVIAGVRVNMAL